MEDLRKDLVYLKDEEIDELVSIGVISIDRLKNLKDYYPFTLRFNETQQRDLINRIEASLKKQVLSINETSTFSTVRLTPKNKYKILNQENYWCSARRSIPMHKVVFAIHDFVIQRDSTTFTELYIYLRKHYRIRSFNRSNLIRVLRELDAVENVKFLRHFIIPSFLEIRNTNQPSLEELYKKLLVIKNDLGIEYTKSIILNTNLFIQFFDDTQNMEFSKPKVNPSFLRILNDAIESRKNLSEYKESSKGSLSFNKEETVFSPILKSNLVKGLVSHYPLIDERLLSYVEKVDFFESFDYSNNDEVPEFRDYLNWIYASKILLARTTIDNYFNNPKKSRDIDIFKERLSITSRLKTLEIIGLDYGVTRERVRQITKKTAYKILKAVHQVDESLIYVNDKKTLSIKMMEILFPNHSEEVLFAFINNEKYFLSNSGLELVLSNKDDHFNTQFLNNHYQQFTEDEFEEIVSKELDDKQESKFIDYYYHHLSQHYHRVGDYFVYKKFNKYKLLVLIVDQYFGDGIRLTDDKQLNELVQYYIEVRGFNDFKESSKRAVVARLAELLDLIDKGTYTSRRNLGQLNEETKFKIRTLADRVLPKPVYYDYIYENLGEELTSLYKIRNHHHLHGLMKVFMRNDYVYHRDYFASERIDAHWPEIESKLMSLNRIITDKDYEKISTSQSKTSFSNLNYSSNWIYLGNKRYLPRPLIEKEMNLIHKLRAFAIQLLKVHSVYHVALLFPYINQELTPLRDDYGIDNTTALSNLMLVANNNHWKQLYNYIFQFDVIVSDRFDVVKHLINDLDRVSIQEVYYRIAQIGDKVLNGQELIDKLFPVFTRISQNELMKPSNIRLNEMELAQIDSMIASLLITRKGVILSKFKSFDKFPVIDFEWNEHLLASIIRINFSHYRLIYTENNYTTTSYLVVKSSSVIQNYEQFKFMEESNE